MSSTRHRTTHNTRPSTKLIAKRESSSNAAVAVQVMSTATAVGVASDMHARNRARRVVMAAREACQATTRQLGLTDANKKQKRCMCSWHGCGDDHTSDAWFMRLPGQHHAVNVLNAVGPRPQPAAFTLKSLQSLTWQDILTVAEAKLAAAQVANAHSSTAAKLEAVGGATNEVRQAEQAVLKHGGGSTRLLTDTAARAFLCGLRAAQLIMQGRRDRDGLPVCPLRQQAAGWLHRQHIVLTDGADEDQFFSVGPQGTGTFRTPLLTVVAGASERKNSTAGHLELQIHNEMNTFQVTMTDRDPSTTTSPPARTSTFGPAVYAMMAASHMGVVADPHLRPRPYIGVQQWKKKNLLTMVPQEETLDAQIEQRDIHHHASPWTESGVQIEQRDIYNYMSPWIESGVVLDDSFSDQGSEYSSGDESEGWVGDGISAGDEQDQKGRVGDGISAGDEQEPNPDDVELGEDLRDLFLSNMV